MNENILELIGTVIQIKQSSYRKNILDVILEMDIKTNFFMDQLDKFSLLIYKVKDLDDVNLVVGEKVKIKGILCSNLYRNCKYRRRVMIIPSEIKIIEGSDK